MPKQLIILILVSTIFFALAMFVVFKVFKSSSKWFDFPPLVEFSAYDTDKPQIFEITQTGDYVLCLVQQRNLKLIRPPLYKLDFQILDNEKNRPINLSKGLLNFKEINGLNPKVKNYVIAKFNISHLGQYTVQFNSNKGIESTDRFFIRPKMNIF